MAVFRVERTNNYIIMSNYHLRDKGLSLKAKGLLSLILTLPEDWDYTLSGLAKISMEGKDAIRATVVELEKAGYIQRRQTTGKDGKFSSNEYIIREYPASHENPPDEPSSENPSPENPTQINKDPENKDKKQILTQQVRIHFLSLHPLPSPQAPHPSLRHKRQSRLKRREGNGPGAKA